MTLIKIHVIVITYTQRLDSIIVIDCMHLIKKKKKKEIARRARNTLRFTRVAMHDDSTRTLHESRDVQ